MANDIAVLDIQTLITRGFIWLAFGDRMDETSGMSRLVASVTAHFAALMAASEPSIPTMIRSGDCGWFVASFDRRLDSRGYPVLNRRRYWSLPAVQQARSAGVTASERHLRQYRDHAGEFEDHRKVVL